MKDGTVSDGRSSPHQRVPIARLLEKLVPFEKRYSDVPPDFNPAHGPARGDEPFRHVMVKVGDTEVDPVFPDEGYYHIVNLEPEECASILGVKPPNGGAHPVDRERRA